MTYTRITAQQQDHTLFIGLNRPEKRNSFDIAMYRELSHAYGELERNPELRCGLLFAHGSHFTAGLDLPAWTPCFKEGVFPQLPEGGLDPLGLGQDDRPRLSKPLVMAVQGTCLTLGIELLLATDIRVAATDTRFGQIEIKRGIYPVGGATIRLIQEVGWGNAMRYLLTADTLTAQEAYRIGLVQELSEPQNTLETAAAIAQTIAKQAPLGVMATLKSARIARLEGEREAARHLMPDLVPIMQSNDVAEGLNSFLERREARFKGN